MEWVIVPISRIHVIIRFSDSYSLSNSIGSKGEIVQVKRGYARNMLIPRKLAGLRVVCSVAHNIFNVK